MTQLEEVTQYFINTYSDNRIINLILIFVSSVILVLIKLLAKDLNIIGNKGDVSQFSCVGVKFYYTKTQLSVLRSIVLRFYTSPSRESYLISVMLGH